MRRIVTFDWLPDEEQARAAAASIPGVDTILFGRRTYQLFEGFWRHALDDDSSTVPDPHRPGTRSREHRAMAVALNEKTKLVFSTTLTDVTWKHARLLREIDSRQIETMKREPGKDMMIFGSGSIVSQLTQHGLIDEYQYPSGDVLLRYARARQDCPPMTSANRGFPASNAAAHPR